MERGSLRPRLRHHRSFAAFAQYASLLHHARSLSAIITTRLSRSPAHADLAGAYPRRFARSLRRRFAAQLSHKHIGHGGSRATAFFVRPVQPIELAADPRWVAIRSRFPRRTRTTFIPVH